MTTSTKKAASSNIKVGQSVNADGNDTSGDYNLHAELQVYDCDMNTKDEVSGKTNDDITQTIDTKEGNVLKGKPLEISKEGFNMLNFSAEVTLNFLVLVFSMMCLLDFHIKMMVVLLA